MELKVKLDENGYLPDEYAKFAKVKLADLAITSFPFEIINPPKESKSFALTFIDFDSVPVCGFVYIHWLCANIPANLLEIPKNFSQKDKFIIQGSNSCASKLLYYPNEEKLLHRYVGPKPPDKDHIYTLTLYALSEELQLEDGYFLNEFRRAIEGKVLAKACLEIKARAF